MDDLTAKDLQRRLIVTTAGIPEMIDGEILSEDVTIIDVGITRVDADTEKGYEFAGRNHPHRARTDRASVNPSRFGIGRDDVSSCTTDAFASGSTHVGLSRAAATSSASSSVAFA